MCGPVEPPDPSLSHLPAGSKAFSASSPCGAAGGGLPAPRATASRRAGWAAGGSGAALERHPAAQPELLRSAQRCRSLPAAAAAGECGHQQPLGEAGGHAEGARDVVQRERPGAEHGSRWDRGSVGGRSAGAEGSKAPDQVGSSMV